MELPEALRLGRASPAARWTLALAGVALVASLAALVVALRKPQQQQPTPLVEPPPPPPGQQNYAQLVLKLEASSITRRDLDWYNSPTTQGVALGPSFEYSNKALKVKVGGLYCVYAQMNITRLGSYSAEEAVDASLLIRRHTASSSSSTVLTLPLDLSRRSYETVTLFKAVPYRLEKDDRLQVTIEASENASKYGFLNSRNSFFGLFQILDTVPM